MRRCRSVAMVMLAAGALLQGQAPEAAPDASGLEALLDTPIESASRRAQKAIESPQAVEVITAEQIRASGAFRLMDVLRLATSVQVWDESGDRATLTIRGVNPGGNPRTVQILVDGVPMFNIVAAPVDLNCLPVPIEAIEKVEIVRGPSSSLYGANAQMGVIAITTRHAGYGFNGDLRAGAADHGGFRSEAFVAYGGDAFDVAAGGAGTSTRSLGQSLDIIGRPGAGLPFDDATHGSQAFLRPEWVLPGGRAWVAYGYGDYRQCDHVSVDAATLAPILVFPDQSTNREVLQAGWVQTWSPALRTDLRLDQKTYNLHLGAVQGIPGNTESQEVLEVVTDHDPAMATSHDFYHDQVQRASLQANWDAGADLHLVGGLDASRIETGPCLTLGLEQAATYTACGGFLSLDCSLDRVTLSGGARVANETLGGPSTSPRLSITWSLDDRTLLRAGWFTSTRSPMAQEKNSLLVDFPLEGYNILPNPGLKPERAEDVEVGLRRNWSRISLDLTVFDVTLKQFIVTAPTGQITDGKVDESYQNTGKDFTDTGVELALTAEVAPGILAGLNASTFSFKDPIFNLDQQADYSPSMQASLWTRFRRGAWFGFLALQHSAGYNVSAVSGTQVLRQGLPASDQIHFNLGFAPVPFLDLSVYGINALKATQDTDNVSLLNAEGIRYARRELGVQARYRF